VAQSRPPCWQRAARHRYKPGRECHLAQEIRPYAFGRRNWTVADNTVKGAQASASLFNLRPTAHANKLEALAHPRRQITEWSTARSVSDFEAMRLFSALT
jgi:hypothetical protein